MCQQILDADIFVLATPIWMGHPIALESMVAGLISAEPHLGADLLLGAEAVLMVEDRFAGGLLAAWSAGRSSLIPTGIDLSRGTFQTPEVSVTSQTRSTRPIGVRTASCR